MIFEPLAEYIEENTSSVTLKQGTNLFVNMMPSEPKLAVMLKNTYAGIDIDPYIPGLRKGKISLVVRGKEHRQVKALCTEISNLLFLNEQRLSGGILVKTMRPMTEPLMYMVSVSNHVEMSVNLSVIYVIVPE